MQQRLASGTPSPPQSPRLRRRPSVRVGGRVQRMTWQVLSVVIRRQGVRLLAPLVYISGMLVYMGSVAFDVVPIIRHRVPLPEPPALLLRLAPHHRPPMEPLLHQLILLLQTRYVMSQCHACHPQFSLPQHLEDPSTLANDVEVVNKIPGYIMERFDHNISNVFNFKTKAGAAIQQYKHIVLPKLLEEKLIRISPFANRLSPDAPPAVHRLRCLADYEALRFSSPILALGDIVVARMKEQ